MQEPTPKGWEVSYCGTYSPDSVGGSTLSESTMPWVPGAGHTFLVLKHNGVVVGGAGLVPSYRDGTLQTVKQALIDGEPVPGKINHELVGRYASSKDLRSVTTGISEEQAYRLIKAVERDKENPPQYSPYHKFRGPHSNCTGYATRLLAETGIEGNEAFQTAVTTARRSLQETRNASHEPFYINAATQKTLRDEGMQQQIAMAVAWEGGKDKAKAGWLLRDGRRLFSEMDKKFTHSEARLIGSPARGPQIQPEQPKRPTRPQPPIRSRL